MSIKYEIYVGLELDCLGVPTLYMDIQEGVQSREFVEVCELFAENFGNYSFFEGKGNRKGNGEERIVKFEIICDFHADVDIISVCERTLKLWNQDEILVSKTSGLGYHQFIVRKTV